MNDSYPKIHGDAQDINRIALWMADQFATDHNNSERCDRGRDWLDESDKFILALFVRNVLWEIIEHGEFQTHPDDLLNRIVYNMRQYRCRRYPDVFIWYCRAFARQFGDFEHLPRRHLEISREHWAYYSDGVGQQTDFNSRNFFVEPLFGRYYVSEYWVAYTQDGGYDYMEEHVVPFDDERDARFFIAQLVDLLNTGKKRRYEEGSWVSKVTSEDDYICQAAAQLVRDTIAQAPVEATRMQKARDAQAKAERLQREREIAERARRKAEKQAVHDRHLQKLVERGTRVYVFAMENNTCKIGYSDGIKRRMAEVHGHSGLQISKWCCTVPLENAPAIEDICHKHFAGKRRYNTEFFDISYEDARDYLQTLVIIETESAGAKV